MFASLLLAARIERAECRLLAASALATRERRPGADVFAAPVGGGIATFTAPGSPLNKVAGLGFDGPLPESDLEAVEKAFGERGSPVQVEVASLGDPSVVRLLTGRGYALVGFENVSGLALPAQRPRPPASDIEVRPSPLPELAVWLDAVLAGFASPDAEGVPSHESFPRDLMEGVMADMASAQGLSRFLAWRDGVAAGGASLRLHEGVATLCGAATRPEQRRRGVQSALLTARLEVATEAGCDVAVVTTQPGSKSQENVQRQGFDLLYTRAILVRTP